jgi:Phage protein Gp138 N-terminal domain
MEKQITQEQVIEAATNTLKNSLYASMPATVVSYDPTTMLATVQPTLADPRIDLDTGAIVFEPWPPIQGVRVAWPRFGNGFVIAGPLAKYDPVHLLAFDLDPSPALSQGRSNQVANPIDVRRLSGGYWLAFPTDMTGPIADASAAGSAFIIGKDGDPAQIRFTPGLIQLGRAGGDFVALASKVLTQLDDIANAINGLQVVVSASGPISGPITLPVTTTAAYNPASVASALIGAQ